MYDDGDSFIPDHRTPQGKFYVARGKNRAGWAVKFNGIIYHRCTTGEEARRICLDRNSN